MHALAATALLREIRYLRLAGPHPNVVAVTDVLTVDGNPGLVMEFIKGCSFEGLTVGIHRGPQRFTAHKGMMGRFVPGCFWTFA